MVTFTRTSSSYGQNIVNYDYETKITHSQLHISCIYQENHGEFDGKHALHVNTYFQREDNVYNDTTLINTEASRTLD